MLILGGADWSKLYSVWSHHRWQANALLEGDLCIGKSIAQISHDNAWYNGQVNHVWGLGVGLWQMLHEAIWRLIGNQCFPDRIAMWIAFTWLAVYVMHTGYKLAELSQSPPKAIGFIWLILCCRSLWTLNYGTRLVYEETSLYATVASLAILCATVRTLLFNNRADFWACCILSAFIGLIRPTHAIYGLAGVLVCSLIVFLKRKTLATIFWGNTIFAGGLIFLGYTNLLRFGHIGEFGHSLTVTPSLIVYTTRFDNPMQDSSAIEAFKELLGALFFTGDLESPLELSETESVAPWQAPFTRWRDFYMSTFDPSWLLLSLIGATQLVVEIHRICSFRLLSTTYLSKPESAIKWGLGLWGLVSTIGLGIFYLRHPNFCSRYLLDFAPGFLAWIILGWFMWPAHRMKLGASILALWLGFQVSSIQVTHLPLTLLSRDALSDNPPIAVGKMLSSYDGNYSKTQLPQDTRIAYNGHGWRAHLGIAEHILILAVDKPEYIELEVSPRHAVGDTAPREDRYRAMINARFLPDPTVTRDGDRLRVRFPVTPEIRKRAGDELVFLWFGRDYSPTERDSTRTLHSVRWR